jgi:hypothetical protein
LRLSPDGFLREEREDGWSEQLDGVQGVFLRRKSEMNDLAQRMRHAAQGILENERLTADLDDTAAEVLLDWGIACAELVARSTVGLDDSQAEEAMYPRLRATRRLMRLVNRWIASRLEIDAEADAALLTKIFDQAAIIYGEAFSPPQENQRAAFEEQSLELGDYPPQLITSLRTWIEGLDEDSEAYTGVTNDQEAHNQENDQRGMVQ